MIRRPRWVVELLAFLLLSTLLHIAAHPPVEARTARERQPENCKVVLVKKLEPSACEDDKAVTSSALDVPCRWQVHVRNVKWPEIRALSRSRPRRYKPSEVAMLRELDGCDSASSCKNETIPCSYGIEDPSDVLWLRSYNGGNKFVIIFRVCFASLLFFLVSILCEGSLFYPHRPGTFSISVASLLALLAFASLLYLIIVPHNLQLSLFGGGIWESIGYVFLIVMIAGTLPGLAVAWINFCLFAIYFLGFLVEQLVCMLAGILHYLGTLTLYQAQTTLFRLRLIYYRGSLEEADMDRVLLDLSQRFLQSVRRNVFLYRVPNALEQDSVQVVESMLPDHLLDELVRENLIPEMDFEDLSRENSNAGQSDVTTPLLGAT